MWITLLALVGCLRVSSADVGNGNEFYPVSYYLYTKANPDHPHQLYVGDVASVRSSQFNASRPTKIIIHGWMRSYMDIPNNEIRAAYMERGSYNLISLDWWPVSSLNYVNSHMSAPWVGQNCAQFVLFLAREFGLRPEELVMIGHSMAAHLSGYCGRELQRITDNKMRLGYIVALDAALPLYVLQPFIHVSSFDADYVVAVHTNALLKGLFQRLGHVDFYPNGGRFQPGCGFEPTGSCSHARVVFIYAEAVSQRTSFAPYTLCSSYDELMLSLGTCSSYASDSVQLGDPLEVARSAGTITFVTNAQAPYGRIL
ncbi:hypothetical protein KR009_008374 [Drosophila setifemur]|nr:hypothetical protein KR009_008374 [Drosophila setifemur]